MSLENSVYSEYYLGITEYFKNQIPWQILHERSQLNLVQAMEPFFI